MPAEHCFASDQTEVVVVRVPRPPMDEVWEAIYGFLGGESAQGTYSIRDGGVESHGGYRYHFAMNHPATAFEFKLRFG